MKVKFKGSCLKQEDKVAFTSKSVVNFCIVYELDSWPQDLGTDFTLGGCLFEGVKLTKNVNPDKYLYSGYGVGFDTPIEYLLPDGSIGKNVIIFGADMSSSVHIDNKGKLITYFTRPGVKFCLNLHYHGRKSFLLQKDIAKDYKIKKCPLCLGNISGDFSANNMIKTGLNEYV